MLVIIRGKVKVLSPADDTTVVPVGQSPSQTWREAHEAGLNRQQRHGKPGECGENAAGPQ